MLTTPSQSKLIDSSGDIDHLFVGLFRIIPVMLTTLAA
jgi:hypothetical protein